MRLRELAEARRRFGYRRLHVLLRREGSKVNAKRVYRLYKLEGLSVRTKKRKKRGSHLRVVPSLPTRPDERWSMDFVQDSLIDGAGSACSPSSMSSPASAWPCTPIARCPVTRSVTSSTASRLSAATRSRSR